MAMCPCWASSIRRSAFATTRFPTTPHWSSRSPPTATAEGNAAHGREVYQAKLANCAACHKVAGQGGDIGPELSNVGKASPSEMIVESILWPNRQVKESYMSIKVLTGDGLLLQGYKLKETKDEVELRVTATGEVRRIAKSNIEQMADAGSLMPEGLTATMTSQELRDLVRYLSELGK